MSRARYGERFCTAADSRHNADFGVSGHWRLQDLVATNGLAVYKDVNMRPHFAHLVQHAIAQADVLAPETVERLSYG